METSLESYFRALYNVAEKLGSSLDAAEVLQSVVTSVAEALGAKACSLRMLSEDGHRLEIRAVAGLSEAYLQKGDVNVDKSRVDRQVLKGETVAIQDVTADDRLQYPEDAKREGIRSVLCAPLKTPQRTLGVLRVYTSETHDFTSSEIEFLRLLANLAALAISNARLHAELRNDHVATMDALWGIAGQRAS